MNFDAAIFDMDGVITKTAVVHSSSWKRIFDDYLRHRGADHGERFREFSQHDYLKFVDGRPRYGGVDSFLRSRGIEIPYGDPRDDPHAETVCGLGNRKNEVFNRVLEEDGVDVYDSTIELIHQLLQAGVKVGVATSSKNCARVLEKAGIIGLFQTRVDGVLSAELGLKGKPEPDIFAVACHNLQVSHDRAMIVEDAVSGVQAGRTGHFGLVLGVARENNAHDLRRNGADIVVSDLAEISIRDIDSWFSDAGDQRTGIRTQETI